MAKIGQIKIMSIIMHIILSVFLTQAVAKISHKYYTYYINIICGNMTHHIHHEKIEALISLVFNNIKVAE